MKLRRLASVPGAVGRVVAVPAFFVSALLLLFVIVPAISQTVLLHPDEIPLLEELLSFWPPFRGTIDPDINHACDWPGIDCDGAGYIISLDCNGRKLNAPLPPMLGNFTHLIGINCLQGHLIGEIPHEIFTPIMTVVNVGNNFLTGTLPSTLLTATKLTHLSLFDNRLEGTIPDTPELWPDLSSFTIHYNRFTCPFPINLYRAMNPKANTCSFAGNLWDSKGDGSICGLDLPDKGAGNCIVATLPSLNMTDKTPDNSFSSETVLVEQYGVYFAIFSKSSTGSVYRKQHFVTRLISTNVYETSDVMVEAIPVPQLTASEKISDNVYKLWVGLTGGNASRATVTLDLTQPHSLYYSVNITGFKPRPVNEMFYSLYLQHEARVPILNENNKYDCTISGISSNCSTLTTSAGGGASIFFSMFAQSLTLTMDFRAELSLRTQNPLSAPIFLSRGPTFVSGVGLVDKIGLSPPIVPLERQGVGLECEMSLRTTGDPGYVSWENILFKFENNETAIVQPVKNNDTLAALMLIPLGIIGGIIGFLVWRRFRKDSNLKKHRTVLATLSAEMAELAPFSGLPRIKSSDLTKMQTLGTGSFGSVQLATYKGEFVAVKQLNDSKSQEQLDALMREAEVMASLWKSKNIVKLLGVCNESNRSAIVMEFCPRGSLSNYLKRRLALSEYEIFKLAFSIMSGMVVLETAEIVHRDLAARNVLLDEHGFAKVSDFGYSHSASRVTQDKGDDKGDSLGPVKWQAPEALRALAMGSAQDVAEFTSASDVWSFGCTLIEVITGKEPYHGYRGSIIQLATEIANSSLNPLSHLQENAPNTPIPSWLLPTIQSCFLSSPSKRPSFRELRYQTVKAARELHNQYENEVDQADSLLNADEYYRPIQQNTSPSSTWSSGTANRQLSSGKEVFSPEHAEASNKVDLSHVERLNKLGEGSFGSVFLGISQGTYVAIKVLSVTASPDDVRREAGVMTAIQQHRNIVQLYGLISSNDQLQIIMEFAPKGSLEGFLKAAQAGKAQVTEGLQFKWAVGIARGMQALAASKVVHRDLASRNILLDSTLEPKVSDFGMSRTVLDPNQESSTANAIGPIRWFAPECLEMKYSEKSDVWAYGCTLIEIITGEMPFPHLKIMDAAVAIRDGRTPLEGLQQIAHLVPDWLTKSLEMCFKYDAKDRPSFSDLVSFLEKQGSSIQEVREAEEEIQKRRRRTLNLRDQTKIKNDSGIS